MAHHRRTKFTLEELRTPAALLDVYASVERCLERGNAPGAALQLVRATQALTSAPALLLGLSAAAGLVDAAAAWAAAGGAAVCDDPRAFPAALFNQWMRVLQQAGDRMPYKAENWETVLGVVNEARITLEGSGLSCGANAAAVERHVTARLAACRIQEAADDVPAAAPPVAAPAPAAAGTRSQATPGGAAMLQQAASARPSAGAGTGGRSRRRAAVAAQAAIVAAVEGGGGGEDDEEAPGTAGGRRQAGVAAQQQQQLPGSSDQENYAAFNAGPRGPASKPTAKQISSMAAPPAAALGQKQALQPSAGQQSAGTAKRARQ